MCNVLCRPYYLFGQFQLRCFMFHLVWPQMFFASYFLWENLLARDDLPPASCCSWGQCSNVDNPSSLQPFFNDPAGGVPQVVWSFSSISSLIHFSGDGVVLLYGIVDSDASPPSPHQQQISYNAGRERVHSLITFNLSLYWFPGDGEGSTYTP